MRLFGTWKVGTHKVCVGNCKILDNGFCEESLKEEHERSHLTYYNPHMKSPDDFLSVMCQFTPHDKWTRRYWEVIKQVFSPQRRILDLTISLSSYNPVLTMSLDDDGSDKKSRGYGTNCVTYMTAWKNSKNLDSKSMDDKEWEIYCQERHKAILKEQLDNYQDDGDEEVQDTECAIEKIEWNRVSCVI